MAGIFDPDWLIYHDSHGSPENEKRQRMPYHVTVFPDGTVNYRDPGNPYGSPAPHAYGLNPKSLGLAYSGPVGGMPTPEGMKALQQEYEKIQARFPGMPGMGHGEAFAEHKKNPFALPRPSRDGRSIEEASWRGSVGDMSNVPASGLRPLGLLPPFGEEAPPDVGPAVAGAAPRPYASAPRPSAPNTASPPPSPRMALGGPKPMPIDPNTGEYISLERIRSLFDSGRANLDAPIPPGKYGGIAAGLMGLFGGIDVGMGRRYAQNNQDREQGAVRDAFSASSPLLAAEALSRGSPKQRETALSLMLQEKDPVKRLERELKQLEIDQKKNEIAENQQFLAPAPPSPALPSQAPPGVTQPPAMPGVLPGQPTSPPAAAQPPNLASPAPQRPRNNAELRALLQTRSQKEQRMWLEMSRKDPKEAWKILDDWVSPNKEQDKSRLKEAGEAQGKAQAALPGIAGATDSLLKKIDDVMNEPDPKNPGKYLPDPKKPGQLLPNRTLPQVIGSFDGSDWVPTFRSSSVDMQERIKQLGGAAFLQAFEALKGGGAIQEKEGEKATAALARLANLRQSEPGYREALMDFRNEVVRLRQLAFDRAAGKVPMPSEGPPIPQAAGGPPGAAKSDPAGLRQ
jgi:hypothetical protein